MSNDYIILCGDRAGYVTGIRYAADNTIKMVTFGAHNDSKYNKTVKLMFALDATTAFYTLGADGFLRMWNLSAQ